ncbi:MFS transporter [Streptomyces sp. R302]|uniref:MFS transporter n=1 Tax=unclassified Streptomyces TaxID=2593676 RepID=UPI00145E1B5D|nr:MULTISPECIES: MFS transporter [unclassified Streptomyces]NML51907.1 MFS transporter [Streptomyces sp. R301]NML81527.1 MFS transporter [Streptomyces sp. R302]
MSTTSTTSTRTLVCSVTGAAVVALDGTVLTLAQPALQRDLHTGVAQVQWTGTGYLVAVASLLVLAGRLGDRHGHHRVFALGALGFAAASAGIALAPGIGAVVLLRVLQGVCGALLQPATLGMLRTAYPPDRLTRPIALRTGAIGLAAAAGPLLGGALVSAYGWRAVFLLGVPPTLAVGLLALTVREPHRTAPARARAGGGFPSRARADGESLAPARAGGDLVARVREGRESPVRARAGGDPLGALLLALALGLLVHGLVTLPHPGAGGRAAVTLAASAVAALALVRHERRAPDPLLPPALLRSRPVAAGLAALLAASAALSGTLFVVTYFLQETQRLDPLAAGVRFLPLAVLMVLGAAFCPPLQRRLGPRGAALAGGALLTSGVLVLARLDGGAGAVATGTGAALLGAGFVILMVTATAAIVRHAPEANAGVAGGLQQTAMNTGPALGVAGAALLLALVPGGGFVPAEGAALPALALLAALTLPAALAFPEGRGGPGGGPGGGTRQPGGARRSRRPFCVRS